MNKDKDKIKPEKKKQDLPQVVIKQSEESNVWEEISIIEVSESFDES